MLPKLLGFDYVDGVYWSLMFEIIFYAYVLVFLISANFVARLRVFAWGWMALVLLDAAVALPSKLRTILIIDYGPFFAIGIALFVIHAPARRRVDFALLTVATVLGALFAFSNATSIGVEWALRPSAWVIAAMATGLPALVWLSARLQLDARAARIAFVLGGISYPLYLLHAAIGANLVSAIGPGDGAAILLPVAGLILAASYLVWRIEAPLRRLLRRQFSLRSATWRSA
jgi:peptidoglycan/LPS O-acetylase OafA/YrhL